MVFYIFVVAYTSNAYENKGDKEPIDFAKIQEYLQKNNLSSIEKTVYLGVDKTLEVRMIMELIPQKQLEKRLRKANENARKKGQTLSNKYMSHISLNVYITNIPVETLPINKVRTLYRLRWQVELVFKTWKSIGEIHKVKKLKIDRFETMLYAKLIWIMMNWSIFWQITTHYWTENKVLLSIFKMFKTGMLILALNKSIKFLHDLCKLFSYL